MPSSEDQIAQLALVNSPPLLSKLDQGLTKTPCEVGLLPQRRPWLTRPPTGTATVYGGRASRCRALFLKDEVCLRLTFRCLYG